MHRGGAELVINDSGERGQAFGVAAVADALDALAATVTTGNFAEVAAKGAQLARRVDRESADQLWRLSASDHYAATVRRMLTAFHPDWSQVFEPGMLMRAPFQGADQAERLAVGI